MPGTPAASFPAEMRQASERSARAPLDPDAPRAAWLAVTLTCLGLAAWIVVTRQLEYVQSDGLQRVFASLYRWTPYTWGESRFGMLIPLLVSPIANPIANLLAQQVANTFTTLIFPFLLARWLIGAHGWLVAGALTDAVLVLGLGPSGVSFLANELPYPTAGVLALLSLLALDSRRRGAAWGAAALWSLACWMTPSTLFWAVPLALLRDRFPAGLGERRAPSPTSLAIRLAGMTLLAVGIAATGKLVPIEDTTPLGLSATTEWGETWSLLARSVLKLLPPSLTLITALLLAALAVAPRQSLANRPWLGRARDVGLAIAVVVPLELLVVGLLRWVAYNEVNTFMGWRYLTIGIYLICLAGPALVGAWAGALRTGVARRTAGGLSLAALIITVAAVYGPPDPRRGRAALGYCRHQSLPLDRLAHAVIDSGASFVIGEYWKVYPLVFRVNSILYERGERRVVWPLADRAEAVSELWRDTDWGSSTLAALPGDPWIEWCREHFALPALVQTEQHDGIVLYRAVR